MLSRRIGIGERIVCKAGVFDREPDNFGQGRLNGFVVPISEGSFVPNARYASDERLMLISGGEHKDIVSISKTGGIGRPAWILERQIARGDYGGVVIDFGVGHGWQGVFVVGVAIDQIGCVPLAIKSFDNFDVTVVRLGALPGDAGAGGPL